MECENLYHLAIDGGVQPPFWVVNRIRYNQEY